MDKSEWQAHAGETWAAQWRRTDRSFGHLTEQLLTAIRDVSFTQVCDIGCGAGELSLAISRNHSKTRVIGVDVSSQLIAAANARGERLANVSFINADAATWSPEEGFTPSLIVSRHGVMFFDDPVGAFTNLAKLAAPSAKMVFSCFREPSENPFLTEIARLMPNPPAPADSRAPGPFAFADRDYVAQILGDAGWKDVHFEPVDFPMVTGAGEDPIEDAVEYFSLIGPAARAISEMKPGEKQEFLENVRQLAKRNCHDGIVVLRSAAWITSARKA